MTSDHTDIHRQSWPAGFLPLACLAIVLPWLNNPWMYNPGFFRRTVAAVTAVAVLIVLIRKSGNPAVAPETSEATTSWRFWILPALLPVWLVWQIASLSWTQAPSLSLLRLAALVPWAILTGVTAWVARHRQSWRRLLGALCLGAAITAIGTILVTETGWVDRGPLARYQFPYEHPAALGGSFVFPAVVLALALLTALRQRRWRMAGITAAGAVPVFTALALSGTRSSLLGVAVGLTTGALVLFGPRIRKLILACTVIVACVATGLLWQELDTPREREALYTGTFGTRVLFGATALRMSLHRPLTGFGTGTFVRHAPYYEAKTDFLHGQRGDVVYTAHSEPLEILAESGLIGLLLWLGLHASAGLLLCRSSSAADSSEPCPTDRILTVAVAGGLIGMLAESCGSMSLRYHELPWHHAFALGLMLARMLPESKAAPSPESDASEEERVIVRSVRRERRRRMLFWLTAGTGIGYILAVVLPQAQAQLELERAYRAFKTKDRRTALPHLRESMIRSRDFLTWYRAAEYYAQESERLGGFEETVAVRERMLTLSPGDAVNRTRVVNLLHRLGSGENAFTFCLNGLKLNPYHPSLNTELRRILRNVPLLTLRQWIARLAEPLPDENRAYLEIQCAWEAGNREEAFAGVQQLSTVTIANHRYTAAQWALALGNPLSALRSLQPLLKQYPSDPRALALGARLLTLSNKPDDITQAYDLIERAIRLGRSLPEVVRVASPMLLAAKQYDRARQVVNGALRENPEHPLLWIEKINLHKRLGEEKQARAVAREARRRFPDEPIIRHLTATHDQ